MAANETGVENRNSSGGDENLNSRLFESMILLVRIEHIDGQPIGTEMLTETTFKELCQCDSSSHEPYAVEILSPHEVCITYKQGVPLGQVTGELMAIESWMDFSILVTVVIIKRSEVDASVEARQIHWKEWKDEELKDLEKLR